MVIASLLLICGLLRAQTNAPKRKVDGNVITSERDPQVRIGLPKAAHYVGADRWVLYGIADCELHAFVEADGRNIFSASTGCSLNNTFRASRTFITPTILRGTRRLAA